MSPALCRTRPTVSKSAFRIYSRASTRVPIRSFASPPPPGPEPTMPAKGDAKKASTGKPLAVPRPSSSVVLVSPQNTILLLHRVQKSSAFPSAHVFPGGNLDAFHDGAIPAVDDPARHRDGEAYRLGAIRETFEESGILLARNNGFGRLIEVDDAERDAGRKKVHASEVPFTKWLAGKGGRADVDGLIPFTRWVTPTNVPKRFTTQMYVYFLPLGDDAARAAGEGQREAVIPAPTHDGGLEHTAARFLPAADWIAKAQAGEIILFPPQMFLLAMVGQFLSPSQAEPGRKMPYADASAPDVAQLQRQRTRLREFMREGDPPWGEKVISPQQLFRRKSDGRVVLALDKPGKELEGSDRRGEFDRVVLVDFKKEGPRRVEVRWRKDVFAEEHETKSNL